MRAKPIRKSRHADGTRCDNRQMTNKKQLSLSAKWPFIISKYCPVVLWKCWSSAYECITYAADGCVILVNVPHVHIFIQKKIN